MSDETPSTLQDRVLALPFAAVLGLGALTGLLAVALASLTVKSSSETTVAAARVDGAAVQQDGADVAAPQADTGDAAAQPGAAGGRATADGQDPAEADREADVQEPGAGGDEPEAADAESGSEPVAEYGEDEVVEVVEVAESPRDVGGGAEAEAGDPSSASPDPAVAPPPDPNREAEAAATPDELYDMAKQAYDEGRYKDAYRMATKSQRSKPADRTQMLRGRAACRIKDEQNAKEIVKSFKLGDEQRKTLRNFCKDHGVRVGL